MVRVWVYDACKILIPAAGLHCGTQVYCTTMLMVFVMALVDRKNAAPSLNLLPFFVGLLIAAISMTLSMNTGCAMNPARDLSPRIFIAIAGWGVEVFTYVYTVVFTCTSYRPL